MAFKVRRTASGQRHESMTDARPLTLGKRAHSAQQALNLLYRKPLITSANLEQALEISTPTANGLIKELIRLGILKEITGQQRGKVYTFEAYLNLFLS